MRKKYKNIYIENVQYYELKITSEKHGIFIAKIDKQDYKRVKNYHWNINKYGNKANTKAYFYVVNGKVGLLHRFIINAHRGTQVDHINGDTTDNRRVNIRVCDISKNSMNRHFVSRNTSGKIGVHQLQNGRYMAHICVNQNKITLGYFDNIEDAIECRRKAEIEYFGEYRSSNNA